MLLHPSHAAAKHAATSKERAAITKVLNRVVNKTSRACISRWTINVSTATKQGRLTALGYPVFKTSKKCEPHKFNGAQLVQRPRANSQAWRATISGSGGFSCIDLPFPNAVFRDLMGERCLPSKPRALYNGHTFMNRPTGGFDISGTGWRMISGTKWTAFGRRTATGTTTFMENRCDPNCAAGNFRTQPAKVTLSGDAACGDRQVYTVVVVRSMKGKLIESKKLSELGYLLRCSISRE